MPTVVSACSPTIRNPAAKFLQLAAGLLASLWIGLLPSAAQNLVVNGGFSRGTLTGWSGSPEIIGYVGSIKFGTSTLADWIGLNGELYQQIPTEPGQFYTLSFETQGYDPGQSWRLNDLAVFWDGLRIAHYDFPSGEHRFFTPRIVVKASTTSSRLRFVGRSYVSLDAVTLTPSSPAQYFGSITEPTEGLTVKEGQSIPLDSSWQTLNGPQTPAPIKYILNGVTELGRSPSDTSRFQWTNLIPGTHFVSAEFGTARTPPVRVVIETIPKAFLTQPLNGAVYTLGKTIPIQGQLQDNTGPDKFTSVRLVIPGEFDKSFDGTFPTLGFDWTPSKTGDYELSLIATKADGAETVRRTHRLHVVPVPTLDLDLGEGGGGIHFQSTTPLAQTFIPTVNGRLQSIVLYGGHNNGFQQAPITVALYDVIDGLPGTNRLAEVTRTFAQAYINPNLSDAASFPFANQTASLVRGRPYAVVVQTPVPMTEASFLRALPGYAGGNLFQRVNGSWKRVNTEVDPNGLFKLTLKTFMEPELPPEAIITSPLNLATFPTGATIPITALASDPDDTVQRVHFEVNGVRIGTVTNAPYEFAWTNAPSGNHLVRVIAEDEIGATGYSERISILVGSGFDGLPALRALDTASPEGNSSLPPLVFRIVLSAPSAEVVSVDYATRDTTAIAFNDYLARTGRVEFAPGQVEAYVFVRILADAQAETNKRFALELSNPKGSFLEKPTAVGVILDDEPGPGKIAAYEWQLETAEREALKPFAVKLSARDAGGDVVRDTAGPVQLEVQGPAGPSRTALSPVGFPREGSHANNTSGFGFLVMKDMWVTHLRCLAGEKVTLWEESGQMLATASFQYNSSVWQEAPIANPIQLRAGRRFRIATYSGEPTRDFQSDAAPVPGDFQIYWSYTGYGDTFPKETFNNPYQLTDFRYQLSARRPEATVIPRTVELVKGEWMGTVRVAASGTEFQLTATDLLGRNGRSTPFALQTIPEVRIETASNKTMALAPTGYRVRIEASTDLTLWIPFGDSWISDGTPRPWPTPLSDTDTRFFRLVVVE